MMDKKVHIVRKDKLLAGYNGNLEHVFIHDNDGNKIESHNGVLVTIGDLMDGHREIKEARYAQDASEEVLLIHNPEVMYDERLNKLEDYVIGEGVASRGYYLYEGDIFTLTEHLFVGVVTPNQIYGITNGKIGGEVVEGDKISFKVIEDSGYELHNKVKSYAVQVMRN